MWFPDLPGEGVEVGITAGAGVAAALGLVTVEAPRTAVGTLAGLVAVEVGVWRGEGEDDRVGDGAGVVTMLAAATWPAADNTSEAWLMSGSLPHCGW